MAPFTYSSDVNPYASSIGSMLAQRGQIAAQAVANAGALRGESLRDIGGMAQSAGAHLAATIADAPRRQLESLKVQEATRAVQDDALLRQALSLSPSGDYRPAIDFLKQQGAAGIPALQKLTSLATQQQSQHDNDAAELGFQIHTRGNTPDAVQSVLSDAVKDGKMSPGDAQQFASMAASDPTKIPQLSKMLIGKSEWGRTLLTKTTVLRPGGTAANGLGETVASAPSEPKPPTEASIALEAAGGVATDAMALLKPPPKQSSTEQEDGRYEQIVANGKLGKPIPPDDAAWASAYEKRKQLTVDASAGAAATRQATAITAQVAQQKRSQDFTQLQAARADIQKNADTIYSTAHTAAETLRDTVAAAKAGNKFAASQQTLEGTMATLKSQGFSRLNATELGVSANAGNLWDRISGYLGKKAEGQPVPADLQKDMLAFADILDKAAFKKYSDAHDAVNKLYGTSIPKTFQAPAAPATEAPAPAAAAAGQRIRVVGPNGQTGTVPAGSALPAGWRQQ